MLTHAKSVEMIANMDS